MNSLYAKRLFTICTQHRVEVAIDMYLNPLSYRIFHIRRRLSLIVHRSHCCRFYLGPHLMHQIYELYLRSD